MEILEHINAANKGLAQNLTTSAHCPLAAADPARFYTTFGCAILLDKVNIRHIFCVENREKANSDISKP